MDAGTKHNFGLFIAYLIPGFAFLWGLSYFSPAIREWIEPSSGTAPSVGGVLYVSIASTGLGLIVSSVRWLVIDKIHHVTGIKQPAWDFSKLHENIEAYMVVVEFHYRYYQFYANLLFATAFTYTSWRIDVGLKVPILFQDILFSVLAVILFVSSRDTLAKYYRRGSDFLESSGRIFILGDH